MSNYATTTQFKDWLGSQVSSSAPGAYQQLMDRLTAVSGSDTVAQELLDLAEGELDSYFVAKSFSVPVSTAETQVAALLRRLTLSIAAYLAWTTHPKLKEIPERVQAQYDWALEWLALFAAGEVVIPATSTLATISANGVRVQTGGWTKVFDEDGIKRL